MFGLMAFALAISGVLDGKVCSCVFVGCFITTCWLKPVLGDHRLMLMVLRNSCLNSSDSVNVSNNMDFFFYPQASKEITRKTLEKPPPLQLPLLADYTQTQETCS